MQKWVQNQKIVSESVKLEKHKLEISYDQNYFILVSPQEGTSEKVVQPFVPTS